MGLSSIRGALRAFSPPAEKQAVARFFEPQMAAEAKAAQKLSEGRGKKGAKVSQPIRVENRLGEIAGMSGRARPRRPTLAREALDIPAEEDHHWPRWSGSKGATKTAS